MVHVPTLLLLAACAKEDGIGSLSEPDGFYSLYTEDRRPVRVESVLGDPKRWDGQRLRGNVEVRDVPTDRGFWIGRPGGDQLFVATVGVPDGARLEIAAGQELYLVEARVETPNQVAPDADQRLDLETASVARTQPAFLVTAESQILVIDPGTQDHPRYPLYTYSMLDADTDHRITRAEFDEHYDDRARFDAWDADGDGSLDAVEWSDGLFLQWDMNRDGFVDVDEYRKGWRIWYESKPDEAWPDYDTWDLDDDTKLSPTELGEAWASLRLYDTFDIDGDKVVLYNEFLDGTWTLWDVDGDGAVDMMEFPR